MIGYHHGMHLGFCYRRRILIAPHFFVESPYTALHCGCANAHVPVYARLCLLCAPCLGRFYVEIFCRIIEYCVVLRSQEYSRMFRFFRLVRLVFDHLTSKSSKFFVLVPIFYRQPVILLFIIWFGTEYVVIFSRA